MTTIPDSRYVHGTDPREQQRLTLLNQIFNERCLAAIRVRAGERALDVGSGLGQLTRGIARAAGAGRVVGVERSAEQIAEAQRQARADGEEGLVEFRRGDALALPLRDDELASFDLAHARFVLEHVPDPARVVEQMARAVRPGGRVVLADDDHDIIRLWPEPPMWPALIGTYCRTYDRLGNDPYVGRRLVWLLGKAGLRPSRCELLWFGACAGESHYDAAIRNMVGILVGARGAMTAPGLLDPREFDDALAHLNSWSQRSDAALWYAIPLAEGVR